MDFSFLLYYDFIQNAIDTCLGKQILLMTTEKLFLYNLLLTDNWLQTWMLLRCRQTLKYIHEKFWKELALFAWFHDHCHIYCWCSKFTRICSMLYSYMGSLIVPVLLCTVSHAQGSAWWSQRCLVKRVDSKINDGLHQKLLHWRGKILALIELWIVELFCWMFGDLCSNFSRNCISARIIFCLCKSWMGNTFMSEFYEYFLYHFNFNGKGWIFFKVVVACAISCINGSMAKEFA